MTLSYRGYMSSALTDMGAEQRDLYEYMAAVAEQAGVDLYLPHKHTDPLWTPQYSGQYIYIHDRQRVLESDVMVCYGGERSFGVGLEVEMACMAGIPIIFVLEADRQFSRMMKGVPTARGEIRFADRQDLAGKLVTALREVFSGKQRPGRHEFLVGKRIQRLRESRRLSREEMARRIGVHAMWVQEVEEGPDWRVNPSLLLLTRVADVLGVGLSDLLGAAVPPVERSLEDFALQRNISFADYLALRRVAARGGERMAVADWEQVYQTYKQGESPQPPREERWRQSTLSF